MKPRAGMGLMIGAMAGMAVAVGLHMLLSAQPELVSGWLGVLLARISAPGARLFGLLSARMASQELGILSYWLSLQLTLVSGGAVIGTLIGFAAERARTTRPAEPPES